MCSDPLVIHTEDFSAHAHAWLAERTELIKAQPGEDAFEQRSGDAAGLLVRTYTQVNDALLDRMPALKVVGRAGVGLDNIDVPACRARDVEVVYTPDANTQAVVEYVIALICDAMRPRTTLESPEQLDAWSAMRAEYRASRQLDECTIGILGLGRIGKRLARALGGIGCTVLYHDLDEIHPEKRSSASAVSAEELFERSDIVSIHVDGRRENHHYVNGRLLALMPEDAILLNTSRGFVLDRSALLEHLRTRPTSRAYLDVHDPEPPLPEDPLFQLPNAHLYPHLASRTDTGLRRMSEVVKDIWAVLQGEKPRYPAP